MAEYREAAPTITAQLHSGAYGYGIRAGTEAAIHSARALLAKEAAANAEFVCIGLDIKNAFNSINRNHLIHAATRVSQHAHRLARVLFSTDGSNLPSATYFQFTDDELTIKVATGCAQGSVASPALFNLVYSDYIQSVRKDFPQVHVLSIHDDTYVLGPAALCGKFIDALKSTLVDNGSGLQLAPNKFKVFAPAAPSEAGVRALINSNCATLRDVPPDNPYSVSLEGITIAGSPVGTLEFERTAVALACEKARHTLSSFVALVTSEQWNDVKRPEHRRLNAFHLRNVVAYCVAPKITHLERTVPPRHTQNAVEDLSAALTEFAITALAGVSGNHMAADDIMLTRKLTLLPPRHGGIGLGSISSEATEMKYYTSVAVTAAHIMHNTGRDALEFTPEWEAVKSRAAELKAKAAPDVAQDVELDPKAEDPPTQKQYVGYVAGRIAQDIRDKLKGETLSFFAGGCGPASRAIFRPEAASLQDDQHLSRNDAHTIFQLRLFIPQGLDEGSRCRLQGCSGKVDRYGHHGLACLGQSPPDHAPAAHGSGLREQRHDEVVKALATTLTRCTDHVIRVEETKQQINADHYLARRSVQAAEPVVKRPDMVIKFDRPPHPSMGLPDAPKDTRLRFKYDYYGNDKTRKLAGERPPANAPPLPAGTHTLVDVTIHKEVGTPGSGAASAFNKKTREYVEQYIGVNPTTFMPVAFTYSGHLDERSLAFLKVVCTTPGSHAEGRRALSTVLGATARVLQRGNANTLRAYLYKYHNTRAPALAAAPAPAEDDTLSDG